jgi:hypothetical protein
MNRDLIADIKDAEKDVEDAFITLRVAMIALENSRDALAMLKEELHRDEAETILGLK